MVDWTHVLSFPLKAQPKPLKDFSPAPEALIDGERGNKIIAAEKQIDQKKLTKET